MSVHTRSQKLAQAAFACVQNRGATYEPFAKKFPALIHTCGLAQAVAFALAKKETDYIGDLAAVIPLIKALNDSRESVRRSVVESLGRLGDKRAVPALERQRKIDEHLVTAMIDSVLPSLRRGRKVEPRPENRLMPQPIINSATIKPKAAILAARSTAAAAAQSAALNRR